MEIEITIDNEGKVTTKVKGGQGRTCREVTKAIRDALGQTTEDRALPEFYQTTQEVAKVKGGG